MAASCLESTSERQRLESTARSDRCRVRGEVDRIAHAQTACGREGEVHVGVDVVADQRGREALKANFRQRLDCVQERDLVNAIKIEHAMERR